MAVNSKTMMIRCEWVDELGEKARNYGVPLKFPKSIPKAAKYLESSNPWHFQYQSGFSDTYAITQAGNKVETDQDFITLISQLRSCLKDGDKSMQKPFLLHFLSCLYGTDLFKEVDLWAYYPSSSSSNIGSEVMAEFCTHARTIFKKKMPEPLILRHKPVHKRHLSGGNRLDPSDQLTSIHLNPTYRGKIEDKTVVVLDDYLTYGSSFGVASALLQKAGAKKVINVAVGKFGDCAHLYDIEIIDRDVYKPIKSFKVKNTKAMVGTYADRAKSEFRDKFRKES